jgi:hypothetical protein
VIETVLVSNNADVCQTTEENKRSKLELFALRRRLKTCKQIASARSFEVDSACLEDAPDKP